MKFVLLKKRSIVQFLALALVLTVSILGVHFTSAAQVYNGRTSKKLPIYNVETEQKVVAISFDACWGNEKTAGILAALEQYDVVANYFVVGSWAEKYSDDLKMLANSGRVEIGTHTNTHPHMTKLTKKAIELELSTSKNIIESIIEKKVELFRAPFGEYNDTVLNTAQELGLYTIQWDVDSLDWKNLSASEMTSRILNKATNGSIILMHNDGKNTLEALPTIILGLKNKGFEFKTIGDLIYKEDYTIDHSGKQIKIRR